MRASNQVIVFVLAVAGIFLVVRHGDMASHPALPTDMPRGSNFVPSGYDVSRLEAKGQWVACSTDTAQNTDFCRVTDTRGNVVYQGDFLPLRSAEPLPADALKVASIKADRMWVEGPAEKGPVPVIPLANGALLVPAADNLALADRWQSNPAELKRIAGSE